MSNLGHVSSHFDIGETMRRLMGKADMPSVSALRRLDLARAVKSTTATRRTA